MLNVINDNKNISFFYYYFNIEENAVPFRDLECPIIFSISTLRWWNKHIKIFVIDCSPNFLDWGVFPELLNFNVIRKPLNFNYVYKTKIELYKNLIIDININKFLLSKPSIIYNATKDITNYRDTLVVCDSDIFFLKNPLPLDSDYFNGVCCLETNTGYYYFSNGGNGVDDIFESWCSVCDSCLSNKILQKAVATNYFLKMFDILKEENFKQLGIQEEVVWLYIQEKNKNLKIKTIPSWENFNFNFLTQKNINLQKIKNIHLCTKNTKSLVNRKNRGLFCIYIKELRNIIHRMLGNEILKIIDNLEYNFFSIENNKKITKILND
jgi:hypothetical protein